MPTAPFRTLCSHCEARLSIKDAGLVGKRIKCPKCQELFVVEPLEEEEAEDEAPRKPASKMANRSRDDDASEKRLPKKKPAEEEEEEDEEPRARKSRDEDDEDDDRPKKKKKKKKEKKSAGPPWILIGGGVAAIAVVAVVLILVFRKDKSSDTKSGDSDQANKETPDTRLVKGGDGVRKKPNSGGDPIINKNPEVQPPGILSLPEVVANINGPWLEPMGFVGANAPPETVVTFHILLVGDSYKKSKFAISDVERGINEKLTEIVYMGKKDQTARVGTSDDAPDGNARLITSRFGFVNEAPEALAKRLKFGVVYSVADRVITLVVQKSEVPPPMKK